MIDKQVRVVPTTEEIQDYVLVALVRTPYSYMAYSALRAAMDNEYEFDISGLELWAALDTLARDGLVSVTGPGPRRRVSLNIGKLRNRPYPSQRVKAVQQT